MEALYSPLKTLPSQTDLQFLGGLCLVGMVKNFASTKQQQGGQLGVDSRHLALLLVYHWRRKMLRDLRSLEGLVFRQGLFQS